MADTQIGSTTITWGTTDETIGYVESITTTDESNGREDVIDGDGDIVDAIYHGLRTTMTASLVALTAHGLTVGSSITIDSVGYWVDTVATTKNRAGFKTYEVAGWTCSDIAP